MTLPRNQILCGDVREMLKTLPDESIHMVCTSPPYWGLRDYGAEGQLGLEATPEEFVCNLVDVFREVRRVLCKDGTVWLNLGDSYNAYNGGAGPSSSLSRGAQTLERPDLPSGYGLKYKGLKPKDLVGIPWRVAFALQTDGWWLRSDIIWSKPNPMPESVTDRPTKSHEYVFLLSKSERYYYDADAIREPLAESSIQRINQPTFSKQTGGEKDYGPDSNRSMRKTLVNFAASQKSTTPAHFNFRRETKEADVPGQSNHQHRLERDDSPIPTGRNRRTVWEVATEPYPDAHFATYPTALVKPCILAGCPEGGVVLDPFFGSGTTGYVAALAGRDYIGIELNPAYVEMAERRLAPVKARLL